MDEGRSRPRTVAIALLVAAVAVLCAPMLFDQSLWLKDIVRFTYPQKFYLRERLLAGELPLWWANEGLGRPFFSLVQPGVLYPGNFMLLLLPMPLAYDDFSAAHLLVAALGMRAWLLRSECDETEAMLGALVFAFSGYMVSLFGNNGVYLFGAAWTPRCSLPLPMFQRIGALRSDRFCTWASSSRSASRRVIRKPCSSPVSRSQLKRSVDRAGGSPRSDPSAPPR